MTETHSHTANTTKPSSKSTTVKPKTPRKRPSAAPQEWIENMTIARSIFSSQNGSFKLSRYGYVGSIVSVNELVARDPWVLRAIQRGKIRFLSEKEAMDRMDVLIDEEEESHHHQDEIMRHLEADASDQWGIYRKDLPEDAEPGRSLSAKDILDQISSIKTVSSDAVADSGNLAGMTPGKKLLIRPLAPSEVMTETEYGDDS